jgi:magnesium-transporting ATPase (P-type)
VLADGVTEGRRIFANTLKYVLMGTSSNFGNIFSAAGASLFLSFLPMLALADCECREPCHLTRPARTRV